MKTRLFATLTALTLSAYAGASAHADESEVALAWQQPGYAPEIVIVTAPRPKTIATADSTTGTAGAAEDTAAPAKDLAPVSQAPRDEPEIVVVTASRSEVLAKARAAREKALARRARFDRGASPNTLGAPAR